MNEINENSSQSINFTQSQDEVREELSEVNFNSQKFFKKLTTLNQAIKKSPEGKSKCIGCKKAFKTTNLVRYVSHIKKCSKLDEELKQKVIEEHDLMPDRISTEKMRNKLLTKMIVENNMPLRCVESSSFREFIRSLNSRYTPPTRHSLSEVSIPRLSAQIEAQFLKKTSGESATLSVEFDHWSDGCNRSIFGVVITMCDGSRYLCNLRDVSLEDHSAISIVEALKDALKNVPKQCINSIVSDSASSCKLAREMILEEEGFGHII